MRNVSASAKHLFFSFNLFVFEILLFYLFTDDDKYVVFISGLSVGNSTSNPLQLQLLVDHITGHLGDEKVLHFCTLLCVNVHYMLIILWKLQEQRIAAEIVHVVIAGNSVEFPRGLFNGQVNFYCVFPKSFLSIEFSESSFFIPCFFHFWGLLILCFVESFIYL